MTDKTPDRKADKTPNTDAPRSDEAMHEHDKGGEWLRDQVGEDHNLSGSSTFRTLPDQPGTGSKATDKDKDSDLQSNR